jgi:hypothetical protein
MSPAGLIVLAALLALGPALALARRGRREAPVARAERRAREVASELGLQARRDPEIPTTWQLEGEMDGLAVNLSMGSPRQADWLVLTLRGRPWLPADVRVRVARRTFFDWKDGLPGEPADVYAGGVGVVIEPKGALRRWPFLAAQAGRLPCDAWPEEGDRDHLRLRARLAPDVSPVSALRELVAAALTWAEAAETC